MTREQLDDIVSWFVKRLPIPDADRLRFEAEARVKFGGKHYYVRVTPKPQHEQAEED